MKMANEVLAENLNRLMKDRYNNLTLGKKAGLAANTIGNYRKFDAADPRPRSAKLSDLEKLATALEVRLIDLLTEHEGQEQIARALSPIQEQLLLDLDDLAPRRQSQIVDMVRQEAEATREAVQHHAKKGLVTADARRPHARSTTTVPVGEGHPTGQSRLPLFPVADPFAAAPGERESALYDRIEKTPKD